MAVVAAALVPAGCGGHGPAQPAARKPPKPQVVLPNGGRMVPIGGGRTLYLRCVGSGSPTVVLEAGFGGTTNAWSAVQPALGRTTRTCAYDRAGLGNSLAIPGVHDASDEIADLARLLDHAGVKPPYVLVGHSYGGLLARLFAAAHPRDTAGVVLVDAVGRNQERRLLGLWRAAPPDVRRKIPKPTSQPVEDGVDLLAGDRLGAKVTTLGHIPLAVVSRGRPDAGTSELPPQVRRAVERLWSTMQDELAALSSDHVHVVAARSTHFIPSYAGGQPGVVVRAVRAVVDAARSGTRLPPCRRIFRGAGVRC